MRLLRPFAIIAATGCVVSVASFVVESVRSASIVGAAFNLAQAIWTAAALWFFWLLARDAQSVSPPPWWGAWRRRWGILFVTAIPLAAGLMVRALR
jgi:hypothetical protein